MSASFDPLPERAGSRAASRRLLGRAVPVRYVPPPHRADPKRGGGDGLDENGRHWAVGRSAKQPSSARDLGGAWRIPVTRAARTHWLLGRSAPAPRYTAPPPPPPSPWAARPSRTPPPLFPLHTLRRGRRRCARGARRFASARRLPGPRPAPRHAAPTARARPMRGTPAAKTPLSGAC